VPIDGVRSIANFSTGSTGAALSDALTARGHSVTLLRARDALASKGVAREKEFVTFDDLESLLKLELGEHDYDVVIHASAVSDYSVASLSSDGKHLGTAVGKVDSGEELTLKLRRNPKLIDQLRSFSRNKAIRVVGFKLTNSLGESEQLEAVRKLASHAQADLVVHNDLGEIDESRHRARIYSSHDPKNLALLAEVEDKASLARSLESLLVSKGRA
jgi:phosphopantothenoylcysteine synthetase/decarboxylase